MVVFLTGGSGLLGSHVAERLRGRGVGVRALCRAGADTRFLNGLGCEVVAGDLLDPLDHQARRMEGCQAVVHAAGDVYGGGTLERVRGPNVDGTRRILKGAAMAGIANAVHLSTVAVYGDVDGLATEERTLTSRIPPGNVYALTKREAEKVAEELHGKDGLGITILRPSAIFGERDRRLVPRLVRVLKMRLVVLLGSGRNRFAAVYAGNVAEAVDKALGGSGAGNAFNVSEDVSVTVRSLFEGLGKELGIQPLFVSVPGGWVQYAANLGDRLGIGIPGVSGLSLARAARLTLGDNPYPAERARKILGWTPPYSLDEALTRTGTWIREREKGHD